MSTQKVIPAVIWDTVREYVAPDQPTVAAGGEPRIPSGFSGGHPSGPGDVDYSWLWDTTFTPEQEEEWTRIIRRARRKAEAVPEDEMDPHIAVLKQWKNRDPAQVTDAHRDAVLDAMMNLWRLTLKEDDDG